MMLTEENYREKIDSYSKTEWAPLIELIPKIEKTKKFGKMYGGEIDENDVMTMPYWEKSDIVSQFCTIVYNIPIIIEFEWSSWDEGRKIASNENFDLDTIDIPTKCKLITAIVRNDRFCDGALIAAFKSGLILKILKSIERQLTVNV